MEYKIQRKFSLVVFCLVIFLFSSSNLYAQPPFLVLNPAPAWDIDVCKGASATFTADTTGTGTLYGGSIDILWEKKSFSEVLWTVIPNDIVDPLTQIVNPIESTNYRVTITAKDASNNPYIPSCQITYNHSVNLIDLKMFPTANYTVCEDAIFSLQGGTEEGTQWQWKDEFGVVVLAWSSNIADQRLQNQQTTNNTVYYFEAQKGTCIETQQHLVTAEPYIEFTTTPNPVVACKGDVVTIVPTSTIPVAGVSYSWSLDGAAAVNTTNFTVPTSIAQPGTISATATAVGYCGAEILIPYSITQLDISPDNWPVSYCPDAPLPLAMTVNQEGIPLTTTMEWYEDGIAQGINAPSTSFNPTAQSITYQFDVSTAVCSETYSQTITKANVNIDIADAVYYSCPGDELQLTAITDATGDYTITWTKLSDSDLIPTVVEINQSIYVKPEERTRYIAQITNEGCQDTAQTVVEMNPVPTIFDVTELGIKEIQIMAIGGTPNFLYSVDDTNYYYDNGGYFKDPTLKVGKHIAYVIDNNGCISSLDFVIDEVPLDFPPFFTPNGDGVNDTWEIVNFEQFPYTAKAYVVDRFGKMLKKFWGCDAGGWDGTYLGQPMPSDDYWYVIDVEETSKKYIGHFTLIR